MEMTREFMAASLPQQQKFQAQSIDLRIGFDSPNQAHCGGLFSASHADVA
jgi:hypothetical protein